MKDTLKNVLMSQTCSMFSDEWYEDTSNMLLKKITNNTSGYVYFIESKKTGEIKIGVSSNPKKRLDEIKRYIGELIVLGVIRSEDCFELESEIHDMFKDKRVRGEWFVGISLYDIKNICIDKGGVFINRDFTSRLDIDSEREYCNNSVFPDEVMSYIETISFHPGAKFKKKDLYSDSGAISCMSQRKFTADLLSYLTGFLRLNVVECKSGNVRYIKIV